MALRNALLAVVVIVTACAAFLHGRTRHLDTFDHPARTARERLTAMRRVVNGTGLGSLSIQSAGSDRGVLLLTVAKAGEPRSATCRVTVRVISSVRSSAETNCMQLGGVDGAMRRIGTTALTIAIREHVAATVEDRPYAIDRVADRMIALVALSSPAMIATMPLPPH